MVPKRMYGKMDERRMEVRWRSLHPTYNRWINNKKIIIAKNGYRSLLDVKHATQFNPILGTVPAFYRQVPRLIFQSYACIHEGVYLIFSIEGVNRTGGRLLFKVNYASIDRPIRMIINLGRGHCFLKVCSFYIWFAFIARSRRTIQFKFIWPLFDGHHFCDRLITNYRVCTLRISTALN